MVGVPHAIRSRPLLLVAAACAAACGSRDRLPADPRVILQALQVRGVGDSTVTVSDSLAAVALIAARNCAPVGALRRIAHDTAPGGRLLARLQSDGLIAFRQGEACTTFPVLINQQQAAYAELTRDVAKQALEPLAAGLLAIFRQLDARGWEDWRYHFVWSELLDSPFARAELLSRDLVRPLDQPAIWVVYPEHAFRSGTAYYPGGATRDHWLAVTWRAGAVDTRAALGAHWELIYRAALLRGALSSEELMTLGHLGLLDAQAEVNLPILQPGDSLLDTLHATAVHYVAFLQQHLPMDSLMALTSAGRRYTFAMAYRDVGWWVLDELVQGGEIVVPPALRPGAGNGASLRGVAVVVPVYAPYADRLRTALAGH
jgi:hypothetical protein